MSSPGEGGARPAPDGVRLAAALARLGLTAGVEAEGALAVLRMPAGAGLPRAEARAAIVAAARDAGFATVALEIVHDGDVRG